MACVTWLAVFGDGVAFRVGALIAVLAAAWVHALERYGSPR